MLQRLIGVSVSAVATFVVLELFNALSADAPTKYGTAVIIGAMVGLVGPAVVSFIIVRRAAGRRKRQALAEVDRQVAERRSPP
jgi:hypothetical protein